MKRFILSVVFCLPVVTVIAADTINLEGTQSVLTSAKAEVAVPTTTALNVEVVAPTTTETCSCTPNGCSCSNKVSYKNKRNVAPCAVEKKTCVSFCETGVDACCNKTSQLVAVEVPICAPPCATKETVSRSKNGRRAVYDYGKYEVVVKAKKDGNVDVNYRKRLLNR